MVGPVIFFGVILLLAAVTHFYLWARLVRSTTRQGRQRRIGLIVIVALALLGTVGFMVTRTVGVDAWWLAWPGYVWLALLFYLIIALLVLEIPRALFALWQRARTRPVEAPARSTPTARFVVTPRGGPPEPTDGTEPGTTTTDEPDGPVLPETANTDRRLFLARACAVTACAAAASVVGVGMREAFGDLRTVRATIPMNGLDPRLSGFRIALVSDTHFGPFLHKQLAEKVVARVNREQPDMIAFIGDVADGTVAEVGAAAEPLRRLESRLGTYFVTGNHDYSSGVDEWLDHVRELGMRPLLNEHVEITSGGAAFDLAGVNDLFARMYGRPGPDFNAALRDRDTSRPVVLLAHQPIQLASAIKHSVDLQLSGHTHGGQTAPFDRLVGIQQPVVAGLAKKKDTSIFVTRGAGFFGPPVRAGIPPEVAVVELQRASG